MTAPSQDLIAVSCDGTKLYRWLDAEPTAFTIDGTKKFCTTHPITRWVKPDLVLIEGYLFDMTAKGWVKGIEYPGVPIYGDDKMLVFLETDPYILGRGPKGITDVAGADKVQIYPETKDLYKTVPITWNVQEGRRVVAMLAPNYVMTREVVASGIERLIITQLKEGKSEDISQMLLTTGQILNVNQDLWAVADPVTRTITVGFASGKSVTSRWPEGKGASDLVIDAIPLVDEKGHRLAALVSIDRVQVFDLEESTMLVPGIAKYNIDVHAIDDRRILVDHKLMYTTTYDGLKQLDFDDLYVQSVQSPAF